MNLPNNVTEEQLIQIVKKVTKNLVHKIQFSYFTPEDLQQEAFIEGLKGLKSWDGKRPLENFLAVHIKNRLLNLKRRNFSRHEPPCQKCPFSCPKSKVFISECELFTDKNDCEKWAGWIERNKVKENIAKPSNIHILSDEEEGAIQCNDDLDNYVDGAILRERIEDELPIEFRADFLRLLSGATVQKHKLAKLKDKIREILGLSDE